MGVVRDRKVRGVDLEDWRSREEEVCRSERLNGWELEDFFVL